MEWQAEKLAGWPAILWSEQPVEGGKGEAESKSPLENVQLSYKTLHGEFERYYISYFEGRGEWYVCYQIPEDSFKWRVSVSYT